MPTLTPEQQREQQRRRDDAILWTILFLGAFATIDAASLALARSVWRRLAPAAGRDLFDAPDVSDSVVTESVSTGRFRFAIERSTRDRPFADVAGKSSRYRFNSDLVRFVVNGRTVVPAAVKQQVATFTAAAEVEAATLTARMTAGTLSVAEWQTQAADLVKAVHVAAFVIGRGGVQQLADTSGLESIVLFQLGRLLTFAKGAADGSVSDAKAIERAKLYAAAANGSFEQGHGDAWRATGVAVEMRNVLQEGAEHCEGFSNLPGCKDESARGWVPLDGMTFPGSRACLSRCLCRIEYRRKRD
jgi:hypothetical protein